LKRRNKTEQKKKINANKKEKRGEIIKIPWRVTADIGY